MIIVSLIGGLGNQMFQYAAGKRLADKHGVPLKLDISAFGTYKLHKYSLHNFNITAKIADRDDITSVRGKPNGGIGRIIQRLTGAGPAVGKNTFTERHFHFDPAVLDLGGNVYMQGYFQSERYFSDMAGTIRREFTVKPAMAGEDMAVAESIESCDAISVHIRRGDYVTSARANRFHGTCGIEYYQKAARLAADGLGNPVFFVFSDEPVWARANIDLGFRTEFVGHNGPDNNHQDIRLMAMCGHHIIANSTFSWWPAWLCDNPHKRVYAPMKWFNDPAIDTSDIIPEGWTRI